MRASRAVLAVTVAAAAVMVVLAAAGQTAVAEECTGTVEECVAVAARRELGYGGGYISYDAMSRGRVPCSYRGASYYNCRPGAPANPYSRGCSAITRCRG